MVELIWKQNKYGRPKIKILNLKGKNENNPKLQGPNMYFNINFII